MVLLILAGFWAVVFLVVALVVWAAARIFRRRPRLLRVFRMTAVLYLVFTPLFLFVFFPALLAHLVSHAGTRPMDFSLTQNPATWGCRFSDVQFQSRDGLRLAGWWLQGSQEQPAVLMTHGLFRDRREVVERACRLNQRGYPVLVFDLRRHGDSQGSTISLGYQERLDFLGAYDFARDQSPVGVVLLGVSMGGTAALHALPELGSDVRAVVADSPFVSLRETVGRHVNQLLGIPAFPFADVFILYLTRAASFRGDDLDSTRAVSGGSVPVLLIYGREDQRMPEETAQAVFAAVPHEKKQLVFFEGAGHGDAFEVDPDRYVDVVDRFLKGVEWQ